MTDLERYLEREARHETVFVVALAAVAFAAGVAAAILVQAVLS